MPMPGVIFVLSCVLCAGGVWLMARSGGLAAIVYVAEFDLPQAFLGLCILVVGVIGVLNSWPHL